MNTLIIETELKEIKKELKNLNQKLEAIIKIMQDRMLHEGIYSDDNAAVDLISGHYGIKKSGGFNRKK